MTYNLEQQIVCTYYNDYKCFFSKQNVEGIGLGYKYVNGICTGEPCIHVFVSKKVAKNCLAINGIIPQLYKGIKTDVIETGIFTSAENTGCSNICNCCSANSGGPYIDRIRPIQPGYCMSTSEGINSLPYTGTFGYIVTDNDEISRTYCLLSVNKTFARLNDAEIGSTILQPAYNYDGRVPQDVVARLLKYSRIRFSDVVPNDLILFNTIDASVASYLNVGQVQLLNPFIPELGVPRGINSPSVNLPIQWVGCLTGKKTATINSINVMLRVRYQNFRYAWYKDISLAQAITAVEDEGALVCDNNINGIGLLFGRSSNRNVCICNIQTVLDDLRITLLTV